MSRGENGFPGAGKRAVHQLEVETASSSYENICMRFARRMENISPDTGYVLGLLQDIGILVLAHAYGARYMQMLARVREIGQLRLEVAEQHDFRMEKAAGDTGADRQKIALAGEDFDFAGARKLG